MPARVVDGLEAVEIEVAEHVGLRAGVRGVDGLLQAALELAAVDETGQRVVARLVGHLPGDATLLGHILQQDDRTGQVVGGIAQRRHRDLDAVLDIVRPRQQQRAPAKRHRRAARQALAHRIGDRLALGLVDDRGDFGERLAGDIDDRLAEELLRGAVEVIDPAVEIGGHEADRQRIEGRLRPRPAAAVLAAAVRDHLGRGVEHRAGAGVVDGPAGELDTGHLAMRIADFSLETVRRRLAGERPLDVLVDDIGIVGRHELPERLADDVSGGPPQQFRETLVGDEHRLTMDEDGVAYGVQEILEQAFLAAPEPRLALEDRVDRFDDTIGQVVAAVDRQAGRPVDWQKVECVRQVLQGLVRTRLPGRHGIGDRRYAQQHQQQRDDPDVSRGHGQNSLSRSVLRRSAGASCPWIPCSFRSGAPASGKAAQ